jgi:hypothetical protein
VIVVNPKQSNLDFLKEQEVTVNLETGQIDQTQLS